MFHNFLHLLRIPSIFGSAVVLEDMVLVSRRLKDLKKVLVSVLLLKSWVLVSTTGLALVLSQRVLYFSRP